MTRTGTILKAMQAVLLVTVLTPATVFAGSLSHPVTQTQQQPASEAKHINRSLVLTPAEAATNPPVAPQVEIPALPPRHDDEQAGTTATNNYSTAAAPAATTSTAQTSAIVTLPAPAQPASDATPAPVTNTTTDAAPAPVAPTPAVTIPVQSPAPAAATPAATPATANTNTVTTPANATPTRTAQVSHQSRSRHHSDDSFNVGGINISSGNLNRQVTKFFNRRDVKSALAQFGLN
jgi:hypothetical protein